MTPNTSVNQLFVNYMCTKACDCKFYCKNSLLQENKNKPINNKTALNMPVLNNQSIQKEINTLLDTNKKILEEEKYLDDKTIELIYKN